MRYKRLKVAQDMSMNEFGLFAQNYNVKSLVYDARYVSFTSEDGEYVVTIEPSMSGGFNFAVSPVSDDYSLSFSGISYDNITEDEVYTFLDEYA